MRAAVKILLVFSLKIGKIIFSKKGNVSFYVVIMKSKVHVTFLYLYNILPILGVKNRRKLGQI